jgi:hypothetical protein
MTQLLAKAFDEAAKLPEPEQNILANWMLAELISELRWRKAFANSEDLLAQMADEALVEHRAGRTLELDPETL